MPPKKSDVRVSLYVPKERFADIAKAMKQRGIKNKSQFFIDCTHQRALDMITEDLRRRDLENRANNAK